MGSDSSHPLQQFSAQEGWSLGASAATSVNIKETCTLRTETLLSTNLFISQTENNFKGFFFSRVTYLTPAVL